MAIRPKTRIFWHPELATKLATELAMARMDAAANLLADKVRSNLSAIIQHRISRPVYVTGKYAGKWWTARDAGELLHSIRVTKSPNPANLNIWVMVGSRKAYYAAMFEYATRPERGQSYWRPAIKSSRQKMISIFERGA